ncbi:MAG: serine hydrolase domain-containing protein [Pseudomonas sp.]
MSHHPDADRRRFLRDTAVAGAALALPLDALARNRADTAPIDAAIDRALAEHRLVGAVVLVQHDGKPLHRRIAGFADREARLPMRGDALFRLASVSKPVVATTAMALVARGKLDLDAPVTRWLPDFRPALADGSRPQITPRQLLSHSAGLGYRFEETGEDRPYTRLGVSDGLDRPGFDLQENLRRLAQAPLLFAPGTQWNYSLGVDVIGAVVEHAFDGPLATAVQHLVGQPLGWRDTTFHATDAGRLTAVYVNDAGAQPHRMSGPEQVPLVPGATGVAFDPARALDPAAYPSGGAGMVGRAEELMRLLDTLRAGGGDVLPARLTAQMARDQIAPHAAAPGTGFGLGFSVLRDPAAAQSPESPGTWRWGGVYGHHWFVDPARKLSVIALTNTLYEGMSGRFVNDLRDAVYAQLGKT